MAKNKKGTGLLVVMFDVPPADKEEEFQRWYNEEHLWELLSIPGILDAARYGAVSDGPKYLVCYELESPEVTSSEAYLKYSKNPSEWTRKISPWVLGIARVGNTYQQIFPTEVSPEVARGGMAPVLQIGRMDIPAEQEDEFNEFYNTVYAANYLKVAGCIRFRRYRAVHGEPKYAVVYEFEHEGVSSSPEWEAARESSGGWLSHTFPRMKHAPGSPGVYKKIFPL